MVDTAKLVTLKCPNCGAVLKIGPTMTDFACAYCGAQQTVERDGGIISLQLLSESVTHIVANTDKTASELALQRLNAELAGLQHQYNKLTAERQTCENGVKKKQRAGLFHTIFVVGGAWLLIAALAGWVFDGFCAASFFSFVLLGLWLGYVCGNARKARKKIQQDLGPQIEALTRQISATQQSIAHHMTVISSKVPITSPQKFPTVSASTTKTSAVPHTAPALIATTFKPPNTTPTGELTKAEGRRRDIRAILLVAIPTGLLFSFMQPVIPITLGALLLTIFMMYFVQSVRAVPRFVLRLKPERKARNAVKLVFSMLLGLALFIGGIAVAQQNIEDERIAQQKVEAEAERQRQIAAANEKAESLLREADMACQNKNLALAIAKLNEALQVPNTQDVALMPQVQARIAAARIEPFMNEIASALNAGNVDIATAKLSDALAIPGASELTTLKQLNSHIRNATDLQFLTATVVDLPNDVFAKLKTSVSLPPTMLSGYKVLDEGIIASLKSHFAEIEAKRTEIQQERTAAERNKLARQRGEQISKLFSAWDGSIPELRDKVKASLNNPKSFEHVRTTYSDKGEYLEVHMTFRGTNAFGAVVTNSVGAMVDLNGHVIVLGRD